MALPMRNLWASRFAQPSVGAAVWGTGINSVHADYGSPNVRLNPVRPMEGMDPGDTSGDNVTPPAMAIPEAGSDRRLWGYTGDDLNYYLQSVAPSPFRDARPDWTVPPEDNPSRTGTLGQPAWSAPGAVREAFRGTYNGARRLFRGKARYALYYEPTETVSEGWLNKINAGPIARAKPSDPAQYERQTSMQQRFAVRTNDLGVLRGTVDPTSPIESRVVPQRSPVYSGKQRHWDMFPKQQTPDREREFYYRTAGTGPQPWLEVNETYDIEPMEREVPDNPYIGESETQDQYGYTGEDNFYA